MTVRLFLLIYFLPLLAMTYDQGPIRIAFYYL